MSPSFQTHIHLKLSGIVRIAIIFFCFSLYPAQAVAQPPMTGSGLLETVRQSWIVLTKADAQGISCRCKIAVKNVYGKNSVKDGLIRRNGDNFLFEMTDAIGGLNKEYAFGISRPKQGGESYVTLFSRDERLELFAKAIEPVRKAFWPLTTFGDESIHDPYIFGHPSTVFSNVRITGTDSVTTDFSVADGSAFSRPDQPLSGTVSFSPSRNYVVTEFVTTFHNKIPPSFRFTRKREMIDGSNPMRVKTLTSTYTDTTTGKVAQTEEIVFSDYQDGAPSTKEFTLEHYGLPVPATEGGSSRWPLWTGIGACGIAAIVLLRWWVRRQRLAHSN